MININNGSTKFTSYFLSNQTKKNRIDEDSMEKYLWILQESEEMKTREPAETMMI